MRKKKLFICVFFLEKGWVGGKKTKKLFIFDFLEKGEKNEFFYCFLKKRK